MSKFKQGSYAKNMNLAMQTNSNISKPGSISNPLSTCIFDSIDNHFLHGSSQSSYNPRCEQCQNYMADRCAGVYDESESWDNMCSLYAQNNTLDMYTNTAAVNKSADAVVNYNHKLTTGEQLLRNSLERRFVVYKSNVMHIDQFDPNIPTSPYYRKPFNFSRNWAIRHINSTEIDNDKLMNAALTNPMVCADTLSFIWNAYKNNTLGYSGDITQTNLFKHLSDNSTFYENIFTQIMQHIDYYSRINSSVNYLTNTTKHEMLSRYKKGVPNCK